ncbi:MAG: aquaporin [Oscillospiraceae bacterium]|jgi:aquaporin Z|nr:aquaporin [Oscillospiraceae bacterium]
MRTKKYVSEFIGTLILVFVGCGSAAVFGCDISGGHLAVALAFGLAIVATAYVIGPISGCHINPAVSLAMLIDKRINAAEFVGYVISQILGALAGAGLLRLVINFGVVDMTGALGSNGVAGAGGIGGALVVEAILTFIFVFTILGVTSHKEYGSIAGVVIGLTLAFVHIIGIPLTGTSVNPARSFGPAALAGGTPLSDVWVFFLAPLVGAALAALVYKGLRTVKKETVHHSKKRK